MNSTVFFQNLFFYPEVFQNKIKVDFLHPKNVLDLCNDKMKNIPGKYIFFLFAKNALEAKVDMCLLCK